MALKHSPGHKRNAYLKNGFRSKAQWRFFYAKAKTDPRFKKWAHQISERTERRLGPKVGYRSLPRRVGGANKRTIRKIG